MRTRTRTTLNSASTIGYHDLVDPFTGVSHGPYSYDNFEETYESIIDIGDNPNRENNCTHVKWLRTLVPNAEIPRFRLASPHSNIRRRIDPGFVSVHMAQECFEHAQVSVPGVPSNFDSQSLEIAQDMWKTVRPSLSGEFSLVNFILELKDMGNVMNLYRNLRKAWKVRKDLNPKYRRRMADRSDRLASSAILNYQFGIKPFIADVYNVFYQLSRFNDRLRALIAGERKLHRAHKQWYRELKLPADQTNQSTAAVYGMPGSFVNRKHSLELSYVTGTFVYRYTMPDLGGLRSKIGGFLSALGLDANPSIIWNAIPFSFVVDWFFDVSKFLDSLKVESSGIHCTLESCSVSWKTQASCAYTIQWPQASYSHTGVIVKRKDYRRVVLDPLVVDGAVSPRWRLPGANAVVSAFALGHQLSGTGRKTGKPRQSQVGRVPLLR